MPEAAVAGVVDVLDEAPAHQGADVHPRLVAIVHAQTHQPAVDAHLQEIARVAVGRVDGLDYQIQTDQ